MFLFTENHAAPCLVFGAYIVRYFENDPDAKLTENVWNLMDRGNFLSRDSKWSPLLGFWVAGKRYKYPSPSLVWTTWRANLPADFLD